MVYQGLYINYYVEFTNEKSLSHGVQQGSKSPLKQAPYAGFSPKVVAWLRASPHQVFQGQKGICIKYNLV